ncbi:MAG: hypothetical protein JO247_02280 [Chloroflexi bacterium]|nr:hypothetical protein [Chloroflexota bacterium]
MTYLITAAILGFVVYRRMQPQPVRASRAVVWGVVIVLLSGLGLLSTGRTHLLTFAFAPVGLAVGFGLGWYMMSTIHFWRDESTGHLWMRGGALYILIWIACYALRLVVATLSGARPGTFAAPAANEPEALAVLSGDLLFMSMGLWIARAVALVRRSRLDREPVHAA